MYIHIPATTGSAAVSGRFTGSALGEVVHHGMHMERAEEETGAQKCSDLSKVTQSVTDIIRATTKVF